MESHKGRTMAKLSSLLLRIKDLPSVNRKLLRLYAIANVIFMSPQPYKCYDYVQLMVLTCDLPHTCIQKLD